MREVARVSTPYAGNLPILRVPNDGPKMDGMGNNGKIDLAALKRDIIAATGPGRSLSRRALSLKASDNKNPDLVRDLLSRGRDRQPSIDTMQGLARALGKSISDYVAGVGASDGPSRIRVIGQVQAGAWKERPEWSHEDQYEIVVDPASLPGERFALEMIGHSMDRIIPPGSILECIRVFGSDGPIPESGNIVVVRRCRSDFTETTCKRLEILPDGSYELRGESYRPEFADPIFVSPPGNGHASDDAVEIIAIVDRATQQFLRGRRT